jgi:hypothetical protein
MANVLEFILKGCPKDIRHDFLIGLFYTGKGDVNAVEFDIKSDALMRVLQKETEFDLTGNGVYVEMDLEEGYEGFTLFGNYVREEDEDNEYGDAFWYIEKFGEITDADFD